MKIIHYLRRVTWREIGNVLRRSGGCSTLSMIMLILNALNIQNAEEHFPVEGFEMLSHLHSV